ncbi:hypothetical protein GCM10023152_09120 [Agromyces bauzanensis]|uniref:SDR family NAD(P)-dependent oxidoreductase n=1 Tax=Agromyces bauzanensis TaxID=1308924 RepID=A0A917PL97_9MICO|nr:hypothetical protein GCM10011372_22090 [Agromyces bauzanensis]
MVVTRASAGIGAAAAWRISAGGATVIALGRSRARTAAVAPDLGTDPIGADFPCEDQVRIAAETLLDRYRRTDVLANNAGGIIPQREITKDGHELTFQSNHSLDSYPHNCCCRDWSRMPASPRCG